MKGLWRGLAVGALCIGVTQVGVANAQAVEPIEHWNTSAVVDALQALKAQRVNATTSGGRVVVTARTLAGLNVGVYAKACDPTPPGVDAVCHGLEAIISFDPGSKADRKTLADRLNHDFAVGKFLDEPDGTIRLSRYLVFDGGITPANLRAELASLFAVGVLTGQNLWPETAKKPDTAKK